MIGLEVAGPDNIGLKTIDLPGRASGPQIPAPLLPTGSIPYSSQLRGPSRGAEVAVANWLESGSTPGTSTLQVPGGLGGASRPVWNWLWL